MTVLAGGLDVEDEGKIEVVGNPWVSGLVSFVDRLSFAELVPLTQEEGAGLRNGFKEMMSSALVMLSLGWNIQVEKPDRPLARRIWQTEKRNWDWRFRLGSH